MIKRSNVGRMEGFRVNNDKTELPLVADPTPSDDPVLWTVRQVAAELGMTYDSASSWLRRWAVPVAGIRREVRRGSALNLYEPRAVWAARGEQHRRTRARATMGRFLR
jgi:hypothetical protein